MSTKAERSRKDTTILILTLVGGAFGFAMLGGLLKTSAAAEKTLMTEYLQKHLCVVADVRGREVSSYRCDLPAPGTYIDAATARQHVLRGE